MCVIKLLHGREVCYDRVMRHILPIITCLFAALPSVGGAALGDVICDDSQRMQTALETRHGAERQGRGVRGPDALIEMWVTPASGDWVLVQSYANGTSCIVAMGEHWQDMAPPSDKS